ncbi:hypothetical protein LZ30DRAFT_183923 [Colletotrichum cereale]|nr:hypothetical protein LZ30DRAFT_183923 [Colletotrichum cereale]
MSRDSIRLRDPRAGHADVMNASGARPPTLRASLDFIRQQHLTLVVFVYPINEMQLCFFCEGRRWRALAGEHAQLWMGCPSALESPLLSCVFSPCSPSVATQRETLELDGRQGFGKKQIERPWIRFSRFRRSHLAGPCLRKSMQKMRLRWKG